MATLPHMHSDVLHEIFSYMPNDRRTLGAARLASRELNEAASPYFITKASFAMRVGSWIRLHWLMNHQYFSKTITEFFFDTSRYESFAGGTGTQLKAWSAHRRKQAPRSRHALLTGVPKLGDDWIWQHVHLLSEYSPDVIPDKALRYHETAVQKMAIAIDKDDRAPRLRLHLLNHIVKSPPECLHGHVERNLIGSACIKLRNLRSLRFGDFRNLAYDGESYPALLDRVFGSGPVPLICNVLSNIGHLGYMSRIKLSNILLSNIQFESIELLQHPFAHCQKPRRQWNQPHVQSMYFVTHLLRHTHNVGNIELHLQPEAILDIKPYLTPGQPYNRLRRLSLRLPDVQTRQASSTLPDANLLKHLQYPVLEKLELRGFFVYDIEFLSQNKDTLRSLVLVGSLLWGGNEHFENSLVGVLQQLDHLTLPPPSLWDKWCAAHQVQHVSAEQQ